MTTAEQLIVRAQEFGIHLWVSDGMLNFRAPRAGIPTELRTELLAHKALIIDALSGPHYQRAPEAGPIDFPEDWITTWNQVRTGAVGISYTNATHLVYRFNCPVDLQALDRSLDCLVRNHDALRCRIADDEPGLRLRFDCGPELTAVDLSGCDLSEVDDAITESAKDIVWRPFPVGECLFRPFMFKLPSSESVIGFVAYHVIVDGWSFRQIPGFWLTEYTKQLRQQPDDDTPRDYLQCSDYLLGVAHWSKSLHFQRRMAYWRETLRGVAPSRLPPDRAADRDARSFHGDQPFHIDAERVIRLTDLAASLGVTLCDVLLAGVVLALQGELKTSDICVRHLWHGRFEPRLFDMIGSTVNPIILRVRLNPRSRLRDVAQQVHRVALEAFANQVPYYYLEKELNETSTTAFVQTNFQLREHAGNLALESAALQPSIQRVRVPNPNGWFNTPRYLQAHDVNLSVASGSVHGGIVYLESLYEDATIKRFIDGFDRALACDGHAEETLHANSAGE